MTQSYAPVREYKEILKTDLSEEDWNELATYAGILASLCREQFGQEEAPEPTPDNLAEAQKINLKSFVGSYTFKSGNSITIERDESKLNNNEFDFIAEEISEWATMLGSPFLESLLRIYSPIAQENEISLSYSDLLKRFTENALAEYIPPRILKEQYATVAPLGRINVPKTISLIGRGMERFVSERARISLANILLLFMIRFHGEMAGKLNSLRNRLENYSKIESVQLGRSVSQSFSYHYNFITDESRQNILEEAYETDFTQAETIDKVRKDAAMAPSILDMLSLWEAYLGKRALASRVADILHGGYTLKPISKLYELWCLKVVLDTIHKIFGEYKAPARLPGKFIFIKPAKGVEAEVFYNIQPRKSMLVKHLKAKGVGVSAGKKPDFTVKFTGISGKSMTVILDAKYRTLQNIVNDDVARFFWYLVYYGEHTENGKLAGLFFHLSSSHDIHQYVRRERPAVDVHLLSCKPSNIPRSKPILLRLFQHLLSELKS